MSDGARNYGAHLAVVITLVSVLSVGFIAGLGSLAVWIGKVDDRQYEMAQTFATKDEIEQTERRIRDDLRETRKGIIAIEGALSQIMGALGQERASDG